MTLPAQTATGQQLPLQRCAWWQDVATIVLPRCAGLQPWLDFTPAWSREHVWTTVQWQCQRCYI